MDCNRIIRIVLYLNQFILFFNIHRFLNVWMFQKFFQCFKKDNDWFKKNIFLINIVFLTFTSNKKRTLFKNISNSFTYMKCMSSSGYIIIIRITCIKTIVCQLDMEDKPFIFQFVFKIKKYVYHKFHYSVKNLILYT